MREGDFEAAKRVNAGWDFAVSKSDLANRTSCTVGGKDTQNIMHFLDFRVGRWNPAVSPAEKAAGGNGWIDEMFDVEERWHPEAHFVAGAAQLTGPHQATGSIQLHHEHVGAARRQIEGGGTRSPV